VIDLLMGAQTQKPIIWALLLPEAGFRSQVLGLAEAIGGELIEKNIDLRKPWSLLPASLCPFPLLGLDPASDPLVAPWPDIVVACGRRTIPLASAIKRASKGKTFAVYIQNPKSAAKHFDLVISMQHDGLEGPNVLVVDTAIHRVTPEKLAMGRIEWHERFSRLKRPMIGVILGGKNRSFRFTTAIADRMIERLVSLSKTSGASIVITPSRRTEPEIVDRFKALAETDSSSIRFWDGQGDNPYFGMLALCDALIATEDSVSMISEAIASGKPVATVALEGTAKRHQAFIDNLINKRVVTRFDGSFPASSDIVLPNYTALAAQTIRDQLALTS
jgi:mitochondrial fission protein ELM1